jgi:hypothetical protein
VFARLQIPAPYHAPHLYSENDIDSIIESTKELRPGTSEALPLMYDSHHSPVASQSFKETLREVASHCLRSTVRWDQVYGNIANHINASGHEVFTVHPIAACSPDRLQPAIYAALKDLTGSSVVPSSLKRPSAARNGAYKGSTRATRSKIAIVGMSGRFPQANSMEDFWKVLSKGVDTHELVPETRWDHRTHVNIAADQKNVSGTGFGCWLHDAAAFDARYFNMSPREAPQVDPAQRLALMCAAEALDEAGIVADRTSSTQKNRVGVYFGCTSNDWMETNSPQDIDTYFIPGGNRAFIPGRINYHFKFSGPRYVRRLLEVTAS